MTRIVLAILGAAVALVLMFAFVNMAAAQGGDYNFLAPGTFESGTMEGWYPYCYGSYYEWVEAREGTGYGSGDWVLYTPWAAGDCGTNARARVDVDIPASAVGEGDLILEMFGDGNSTWHVKLRVHDPNGNLIVAESDFTLSGPYNLGPAQAGTYSIQVWGDRHGYFDNFNLYIPGYSPEPANAFGLTCTYTNTEGIFQTVSANRVRNPSFEVFNYGSLPAGWSVSSPGSTFYAATDNSYDGDTSLQYQPNSGRLFAQACRSVGIEADTQSIAAGVYFAGGGSGTSDVSILLDGEVLGTTTVSGSDGWTSLTVTDTNDSENLFQQFCVEVQGANRAYIDAAWLYTSDSNDLFGLQCPAPTDDIVPPPPPPPPDNSDDGIPTPAPEDLGTCYRCIRPISIIQIGSWIKWLLCGLQNLFRCELFLWLLRIQNLIGGLVGQFVALVLWLPTGFQIGLNWFGSAINGSVGWLLSIWNNFRSGFTQFLFGLVQRVLETDFVQAMWTAATWVRAMWEYAWSLIQGVLATIGSVFGAAIQVIEMIGSIITGVAGAWTAPGYRIDFIPGIGGPGGGGDIMTAIEADGINDAKVYWILVSGLAALDAIAGDFGFQYLQYLLIGALAFGVIAWSLKQFQDFLPA